MASTSPVLLILGSGPNIGQAVARIFSSKGYKVAVAARSLKEADSTDEQLNITSDFSNPEHIVVAFRRVRQALGIPSVVFYNASAYTPPPLNDPFSISLDGFNRSMAINTTSVFVAAQQATLGFAELPSSASKSFFFTGNILNLKVIPSMMDAGAGKSATAHMMMAGATVYKDRGFKFYYVDERKPDGTAKFKVDGDAHGKLLWDLAEAKTQGPWLQLSLRTLDTRALIAHTSSNLAHYFWQMQSDNEHVCLDT